MNLIGHTKKIKKHCDKIICQFVSEKKIKAIMAYQRFNEYLLRLERRYKELIQIEKQLTSFWPGEKVKRKIKLENIQLKFVDKTEAFYQQVYAVISAYILLLNHIANKKFISQMPIRSVRKFLTYVSKINDDKIIQEQATILMKSTDFRSKFIDHPQQHALHNWMTYSYITGTTVIYYVIGNGVCYKKFQPNPYAEDFRPPIVCKSFYVAPSYNEVYQTIINFTGKVLQMLYLSSKNQQNCNISQPNHLML